MPTPCQLAFYGDDFTGSTDALESMALAGADARLVLAEGALGEDLPGDALGLAGNSRALRPEAMEAALRPAFARLKALHPAFVHYKVCSTFDSSPTVGSIGRAIEIGRELFPAPFVPVVVGAPYLARYCAFGNLFARMGTRNIGEVYRLDRHPSMSRHPVTPADESDLRRHLARQTDLKLGLIDLSQLNQRLFVAEAALADRIREGCEVIFFDAVEDRHLAVIGELLKPFASPERPLFGVGSSGLGRAVGTALQAQGVWQARDEWPSLAPVDPLLVVSGSASPITAGQIRTASDAGFAEVALDTPALLRGEGTLEAAIDEAVTHLRAGRSVVAHTCIGPDDPRLQAPVPAGVDTAVVLGGALGRLAHEVAAHVPLPRVVVAGGDSSSYAGRAMGITSLEMLARFAPGAPFCRAHAPGSSLDGAEVNFKGGQVGAPDYFLAAQRGQL